MYVLRLSNFPPATLLLTHNRDLEERVRRERTQHRPPQVLLSAGVEYDDDDDDRDARAILMGSGCFLGLVTHQIAFVKSVTMNELLGRLGLGTSGWARQEHASC